MLCNNPAVIRITRTHRRRLFPLRHALIGCLLALVISRPLRAENTASCESPDWFSMQQAKMQGRNLPPLCQAELDAATNRDLIARRELEAIIKQSPHSSDAYEAHSTLAHFYLRNGRFHNAEEQLEAMLSIRPTAPDLQNTHSLFELLGKYPDLAVSSSRAAVVRSQTDDGNIFAPVAVNGVSGTYMLDTGLNLSMMSESEAARLGLKPQSSITTLSDIGGRKSAALKVVNVDDLIVGGTHIRHVPFLVMADTNGAFTGLPSGHRGILGIQPLFALGTLSFRADETLEIGARTEPGPNAPPLLFDREMPLTQVQFQGKRLTVTLDCGATQTTFNPPFAQLYANLVESGTQLTHDMHGLSGTTAADSVSLPHLALTFGREVNLAPAIILTGATTGTSSWTFANVGYDLLKQVRPFTVDFKRMKVEFPTP